MNRTAPYNPTWLDKVIEYVSPKKAAERTYYRETLATYRGAVPTRTDTPWAANTLTSTRTRERLLRNDFRSMRDRARSLEQNNVLAGAVLDRAEENVIGTGIRIRPTSSSPEFNAAVAARWKLWTSGKTADIGHRHTFAKLQRLFYRAKLRDGDCGLLLTEEKDSNGVRHPRLQVIEGEHIDTPPRQAGNLSIIDGIELNANNAAARYWLLTEDERGRPDPDGEWVKAKDFVFLVRPALYSSVRGESAFNGGWGLFDNVVGYMEAVVMTSRAGASQALLITKTNPANLVNQLPRTTKNADGETVKKQMIEPLMIHYLGAGEDVKAFNPTQPQQNFPDAIAAFVRFIGLRFGLTIEQLLLDFSRTNYSSSRAARIQADQTAYMEQDDFAATFFSRVYPWFISKQVKEGLITVPPPPDAWAYEWIPQGKPWVDPTKEIAAARDAVALGVETRSNIAMERGYDFRELCKTNAADAAELEAHGLPTSLDGEPPEPEPEPLPALPAPTNGAAPDA